MLCCVLSATFLLQACAGKQASKSELPDIVLEPQAKEKAPVLSPQEIQALKSSGEIDRNLSSTAMADVTKQYAYYLRAGRKHMNVSIARCGKYLPYVREVFHKRGLPRDLAYLAIVESGFRTDAKSPVGAAGAWQFMKGTGVTYGLDNDTWTDDRLDIYEATEAAASYLGKLYAQFHDWPTAIAAYNAGEGKMRRAMQESGGHNFFEVRERNEIISEKNRLREETKQYVPRFLAVVKIMRNLKTLNFTPIDENQAVKVCRVMASPATDLKSLSRNLNIEWGEFCLLNRHHQGPLSSATRETYVYVPEDKVCQAKGLLAGNCKGEYTGWQTRRIEHTGHSWKSLERKYRVSGEKLRAANPGCTLKAGEYIYLPGTYADAGKRPGLKPGAHVSESFPRRNAATVHTLRANETVYAVARRYGVSPIELMRVNGISNPSALRIGSSLRIPGPVHHGQIKAPANGQLGKKQIYVVKKDDTFWNIARRLHVSVEDLYRWNGVNSANLREGTRLAFYAEGKGD